MNEEKVIGEFLSGRNPYTLFLIFILIILASSKDFEKPLEATVNFLGSLLNTTQQINAAIAQVSEAGMRIFSDN